MNLLSLKNRPLTIIIGFNLFTLLVFFTAPVKWETDNLFLFLIFSLFCQIMIVMGYNRGYRKYKNADVSNSILFNLTDKRLNLIFLFYLFTILIQYAYILKFNWLDIKGMVDFLMIGIADPQIGYALSIDTLRPHTIHWTVYFFISIINQVFFIIGFLKWNDLSRIKKYLFIFFVLIELFFWLGRGTNFGIICMITTFAFSSLDKLRSFKSKLKQTIIYSFFVLLLFFVSISVFTSNMKSRAGNNESDLKEFSFGFSEVNESHYMLTIIPQKLHSSYMYIVSYLSQGYYHTCLAFDLNFKSTYFLGNNPSLIELARLIHIDVWEDTYIYRLRNKGVDPLINWHSSYVWFASDFSFFGVPLLIYFIGFFYGVSWAYSLNNYDFLSKILFIIFGNMLLYLFANNTYLSNIFYSYIFLLPIWYFTRVKLFM